MNLFMNMFTIRRDGEKKLQVEVPNVFIKPERVDFDSGFINLYVD